MTSTPLAEVTEPDWTWLFLVWNLTTRLSAWQCQDCGRHGLTAWAPAGCTGVWCAVCPGRPPLTQIGRAAYLDVEEGQDRAWYEWVGRLGIDGAKCPLPAVVIADDENRRVAVVDVTVGWHPRAPFAERVIVQLEAVAPPFPPSRPDSPEDAS